MFFGLATEITEITNFFGKLPLEFIASSLLSVNIFLVKALRQWRQIREAMKRWNFKYGKKLKQWSDEAFNVGKKSEAMKRLTLHRIASSLHRFIASSAQLCLHVCGREHFCKRILPVFYLHLQKNVSWRDESWTAFCGLITATIGGLWAERLVKSTRHPSKWHYTYGGSSG